MREEKQTTPKYTVEKDREAVAGLLSEMSETIRYLEDLKHGVEKNLKELQGYIDEMKLDVEALRKNRIKAEINDPSMLAEFAFSSVLNAVQNTTIRVLTSRIKMLYASNLTFKDAVNSANSEKN